METRRNSNTCAVGFSLLPSELIQYIILQLALPYVFQLRSVSKSMADIISDEGFLRDCNLRSSSDTWLFIYKKRYHRDAVLLGFTASSDRWFKVLIGELLKPVVPPGEDLYFLTAAGNFFLFALNNCREVISVNPIAKTVKKIPRSPLGPRGTSSWRRSGMKLLSDPPGSGHFRFLYAELVGSNPVLFEYSSKTNSWTTTTGESESESDVTSSRASAKKGDDDIIISASNGPNESVMIMIGSHREKPMILRPRFNGREIQQERELAIGFGWGNVSRQLHIYGDGKMLIVRSGLDGDLKGAELWGLSPDGMQWDFISKVPNDVIDEVKKPYGVMMGCLEERQGTIRVVLMSNFEGVWDIIWLCYDVGSTNWKWVPLPDCKMKGSNMAGITFSSGLTL